MALWTGNCPLQSSPQLKDPATDQQQLRTVKLHTEEPCNNFHCESLQLTVLCTFLFIPCQALSQASLPGSKYLASYRESFLAIFPAKNSCSAVVYISEGCRMLTIWAIILNNSSTTTLSRGWKGFLAALTWLSVSRNGNPTDCMVWRAGASNIMVWEMKCWWERRTSTMSSWHNCDWNECWHLPHLDSGSTF